MDSGIYGRIQLGQTSAAATIPLDIFVDDISPYLQLEDILALRRVGPARYRSLQYWHNFSRSINTIFISPTNLWYGNVSSKNSQFPFPQSAQHWAIRFRAPITNSNSLFRELFLWKTTGARQSLFFARRCLSTQIWKCLNYNFFLVVNISSHQSGILTVSSSHCTISIIRMDLMYWPDAKSQRKLTNFRPSIWLIKISLYLWSLISAEFLTKVGHQSQYSTSPTEFFVYSIDSHIVVSIRQSLLAALL